MPALNIRFGTVKIISLAGTAGSFNGLRVVLDLNGDGYDDLINTGAFYPSQGSLANAVPLQGMVLWGGADGFTGATASSFPLDGFANIHARELVKADFNNDGLTDFFIANHGYDSSPFPGERNQLFLSQRSGSKVSLINASEVLPAAPDYTHSAATGDVNADGNADVFAGDGTLGKSYFLIGDGKGGFVHATTLLPAAVASTSLTASHLADLNGDNLPELIVGTPYTTRQQQVLWNSGGSYASGTATALPPPANFGTNWSIYDIQSTDVNYDGRQDLLVNYFADLATGGWQLQVLINQGDRVFTDETARYLPRPAAVTGGVPTSTQPWIQFLIPTDFNKDGRTDYFIDGKSSGMPFMENFPAMLLHQADGTFEVVTLGDLRDSGAHASMVRSPAYSTQSATQTMQLINGPYVSNDTLRINVQTFEFPQADTRLLSGTSGADSIQGTANAEQLAGFNGNDTLQAAAGADRLTGGAGNDTLDGGEGIDVAIFAGSRSDYRISTVARTTTVQALKGDAGTDSLVNVERLQFANAHVALDVVGDAGRVAKLLGAVFGAGTVLSRPGDVGIGLHYFDSGIGYEELAALALGAAGAKTPQQVVERLYTNITGKIPTATQAKPFLDLLAGGMTVGSLGVLAAESELNKVNIGLVGLLESGITFTPYG